MIFPNQTDIGLEFSGHWQWSSKFSKPIWIWFGICVSQNQFFLSKPNWSWFGKLYAIFGCNFSKPNWIWFWKRHWMKCSCTDTGTQENTPPMLESFFEWLARYTNKVLWSMQWKKMLWQGKDISLVAQATCLYKGCKSKWVGNLTRIFYVVALNKFWHCDRFCLCHFPRVSTSLFVLSLKQICTLLTTPMSLWYDDNHPNIIVVLL